MERTGRIACSTAIAGFVTFCAGGAFASADATTRCHAAKTKLAGDAVACLQRNAARTILTGRASSVCDPFRIIDRWHAIEDRAEGACAVENQDLGALLGLAMDFSREMAVQIDPPTKIVLYDAGAAESGDFLGLDGLSCSEILDESFSCTTLAPLLSLEDVDSLADALYGLSPRSVPIFSRGGVKIADDADDFLDGTWDACLQESAGPDCAVGAGVLPDGALWWHGSDFADFGATSDNCNDFSSTRSFFVGNVGIASSDGEGGHASPWDGLVAECDGSNLPAPAHLVCACGQR